MLISTFIPSRAFSQGELRINVLNPPKKTAPGGYFTLFFEVENISNTQNITQESLILPENWQMILSKKLTKTPNKLTYIYTVASSSVSTAGNYDLALELTSNSGDKVSKKINIEVSSFRKIEIIPLSAYEYAKEGDSLHFEYLIQNLGNGAEKVKLKTSRGQIQTKNDSLTVEPHKSIQVRVTQIVPKTQSNYWLLSSDLFVSLKDSANPVANFSTVPVYSNKNKKKDPYLRFPIEVGGGYNYFSTNRTVQSAYQYDIRGRGFLDFKQEHHFDFTIHGPNQIYLPTLGSYDQYSFIYSYKKQSTITAGDYLLSVNNLMEFGRYGRGLRFDQNFKKTGLSVFYVSPRFYPNQKETYGASFYIKPKENLKYSFDFLSKKTRQNEQLFRANFIGVSVNFRTNSTYLVSEVSTTLAQNKVDFGIFNRVYYHYKKLNLNSDLVYTGKNFYGFYHNSWQAVNAVYYNVFKKISVGLQSNFTRVNPSFDFNVLNTSPYFSSNSIIANYDIKKNNRLILSYNLEEKEDKKEIKQFYFKEQYGRLAYLINTEKLNLWLEGRIGNTNNLLASTDETKKTQSIRSVIQPQVRVLPWLWLGTFFEYQQTAKFSTTNELTNYYYYGGTSRVTFGNIFNASFSYRNNFAPDELVQKRSFLDLTAELNLKNHRISLVGGRAFIPNYSQTNENTLYFMLKYTLKLNAPLAKNKKLGAIKGRISGANNLKKEGVLVALGDKKYLTDANGEFYFNDLVPDKYYLTLDKSTLKTGVVTDGKTPIEVEVSAKTTSEISIPLVNSGGIVGKVSFQENSNSGDKPKKKPIVLVKLFNETDKFITKANDKGDFSFKEMKPGSWQVELTVHGNEENFTVENPIQNIIIEAEKIKEMSFSIIPKERKIYFSDKNFQLSAKK